MPMRLLWVVVPMKGATGSVAPWGEHSTMPCIRNQSRRVLDCRNSKRMLCGIHAPTTQYDVGAIPMGLGAESISRKGQLEKHRVFLLSE
jgi:hypothetical protein